MDFEINSDWTVIDGIVFLINLQISLSNKFFFISDIDQFLLFIAANNNAISKDMVSNPFAHLNDGFIDVVVSRKSNKSLSRGSILKAFLGGFETGEYVKEAMVEYYKVKGNFEKIENEIFFILFFFFSFKKDLNWFLMQRAFCLLMEKQFRHYPQRFKIITI